MDLSDPESPLILNEDFTVPIFDKNQSLSFQNNVLFYAVCPVGTRSTYIDEEGDNLACKSGTNVLNIRTVEIFDFTDIKCKPTGPATVKKIDQQCWTNGTLFEIGFNVYNEFVSMVTVCFDEVKLAPIYSKYNNTLLSDAQWSGKIKHTYEESLICDEIPCEWVNSGNVYFDVDVDVDAVYNNQAEILHDLGIDDLSLARFPLTMGFLSQITSPNNRQRLQYVPYFDYMNVVPVWNIEESVEALMQIVLVSVADSSYTGQTVISGTLGVITVPDNEETELYLNDGKIPVPRWLWLVWDEMEAIGFYYNGPYPDEAENEFTNLCYSPGCIFLVLCICEFNDVIDKEMKQFIDNNFI